MKKNGLFIVAALVGVIGLNVALAADTVMPAATSAVTANVAPVPAPTPAPQTDLAPALEINKLKSGERALNVGHYNQLPPFYFADNDPQPGFGHDIFVEVAKKAGIPKVHFVGFDNTIDLNAQLQQGRIDVIANAWDLPGVRKQFLVSDPYYKQGGLSFLYLKKNGTFQTADDLKNHYVGTFERGYAQNYWLPAHGVNKDLVKTYSTIRDLMFALKEGQIDVAVVYYPLAQLAQQQLTDQLASTLVQPINDVYAVRKQDTELQTILNQAIQALTAEGALDKIATQYLAAAPEIVK